VLQMIRRSRRVEVSARSEKAAAGFDCNAAFVEELRAAWPACGRVREHSIGGTAEVGFRRLACQLCKAMTELQDRSRSAHLTTL
jgi:hypothetical protein